MEDCWLNGAPDEIGGLRTSSIFTSSFKGTPRIAEPGSAVSSKLENFDNQAAVGLRLRLPSGLEAITTATHAFIRLANAEMSCTRKCLTEYTMAAQAFLKRLVLRLWQGPPTDVAHSNLLANSPLGKEVWLGETDTCVCIVTFLLWENKVKNILILTSPDRDGHGDLRPL